MSVPLEVYDRLPKRLPHSLGFSRHSLYFDGTDYVALAFFPYETADFTIELILKVYDLTTQPTVVSKGNSTSNTPNVRITLYADGSITFLWRDDSAATFSVSTVLAVISTNRFYDIMVTRVGNNFSIYVNNVLRAGPTALVPGVTTLNRHTLGALGRIAYVGYLTGEVAVARVYSRALTEGERIYNMLNYHNPVRSGLEMWLADRYDAALATVYDLSGNARNGANAGATGETLSKWELRSQMNL